MDVQSIYHKLPKTKFLKTWIVLGLDVLVSFLASAFVLVLTAIILPGRDICRDIRIEFTGLCPGEKLYEELLATKENTLPTSHDRIFIAKAREYPYASASDIAAELAEAIDIPAMVRRMKTTVPEFK